MNKKLLFALMALALIFPMIFSIEASAQTKIPLFFIKSVVKYVSVTVETKDFPYMVDFVVYMGEFNTRGINGIPVAEFTSGEGGKLGATFNIPDALKGRAQIAIRMEGTGGYYSYNWFWNDPEGTWPVVTPKPTAQPTVTPVPTGQPTKPMIKYPSFFIEGVVRNESVTIHGYNYPANTDFIVRMGKMWTAGIGGIEAAKFNTGAGGEFVATFSVPAELKDMTRIAIRTDGTGGWYAYNWFWNNTTK